LALQGNVTDMVSHTANMLRRIKIRAVSLSECDLESRKSEGSLCNVLLNV
jgi:hypothetical protein